MIDEEKIADRNIDFAQRAFDKHQEAYKAHVDQILSFSNAAMRAPAVASAGGIVAIIGFFSANYARLSANAAAIAMFGDILFYFFASILLAVISPAIAYFSQVYYARSLSSKDFSWEHPYIMNSKGSIYYEKIGDLLRRTCIFLVTLSIVLLASGGIKLLQFLSKY